MELDNWVFIVWKERKRWRAVEEEEEEEEEENKGFVEDNGSTKQGHLRSAYSYLMLLLANVYSLILLQ